MKKKLPHLNPKSFVTNPGQLYGGRDAAGLPIVGAAGNYEPPQS